MIQKRMNFLNYILNESTDSMIHKVYIALREDSHKGDFKALTDKDRKDLEINLTDEEVKHIPKVSWKKFIKEKVTLAALNYLSEENNSKEKTKPIKFDELK